MNSDERLPRPLDAELLRSFLVVAACENVTRAAAELGRTQSAISVQLRRLEDELGAALFVRQARGMTLTAAGERLLPAAHAVVDELGAIRSLFDRPMEGRVGIGIPDDHEQAALRGILETFTRQHPAVEVFVRCALSVTFPAAIASGELDLAVHTAEPGRRGGRKLRDEPLVWAARADWERPRDGSLPLVLFDRACWWRSTAVNALRKARVPFRPAFESESGWGVAAAIASGLGVGVVAAGMVTREMRVLGRREGLPPLPKTRVVLLSSPRATSPAASAMRQAVLAQYIGAVGPR